jgi:glycosyltransferase involved in cell wall biosynthesis
VSATVSILMPTFNRLQYLAPAIESVLAQTLPDWELIIADDGSDSPTRTYLEGLADRRIRVLWLTHSGKPAVALNVALRSARAPYVAFLDSDDLWLAHKLETQVASLQRHAGRRWSCTTFALVDASGRPLNTPRAHWPAPAGWVRERLLTDAVIAMPSVLIARSLLEEVGPLDEELTMCYDDELWLRLAGVSELDGVQEALTLVRRHAQHGGSDIIAWCDRRRVVEKALRRESEPRFLAILLEQRALMSAGLARSHARYGSRADVLRTLAASVRYSWRYRGWWAGALWAAARAWTPQRVRALVRALRT